jgi:hypothetical protein
LQKAPKSIVQQKPEGRKQPASPSKEFDPVAFAAKLVFNEEVEALGLTEEDTTKLGIGWHPQRKDNLLSAKGRHRFCLRLYRLCEW